MRGAKYSIILAGAALLAAIAGGILIGRIGAFPAHAIAVSWQPPAEIVQPTSTPPITQTAQPTTAPVRVAPRTPTAQPTPTAPLTASAPPLTAPTAAPFIEYTVQPGDILNALAARFNTTAEAIIAFNPQINADSLVVGSVLRIPRAGG